MFVKRWVELFREGRLIIETRKRMVSGLTYLNRVERHMGSYSQVEGLATGGRHQCTKRD